MKYSVPCTQIIGPEITKCRDLLKKQEHAMFCSECGKPAGGKFCSHCGTPLAAAEVAPAEVVADWDREVRYETILKFPGVRDTIERHARQAPKRMSGEQFLALADKLVPLGVPLEGLVSLAQPFYERMGIKTGKERARQVGAPVAKVIVRALCSLARHGQTLRGVTQAADGCLLEASLPSDLFSLEGKLVVSVRRDGPQAEVCGATHIPGQLYDWGKSNRCLNALFTDLTSEAA
jgi:hypothetical protein